MVRNFSWLAVAGAVVGGIYGLISVSVTSPGESGLLGFAAFFGAAFGAFIGGAGAAAAYVADRARAPRALAAVMGGVGSAIGWSAILVWSVTLTSSTLDAATWTAAVVSVLGCTACSSLIVGWRMAARAVGGPAPGGPPVPRY